MSSAIRLRVNGRERTLAVAPQRKLLDVLRNELRLTGTKYGCGEAQCGACTVLLDGKPIRACSKTVAGCEGKDVTTIEGLAVGGALHPVQRAFIDEGAMQCGYCTPGMILSAVALLRTRRSPSDGEIVAAMRGNICRCGTYPRIVRAIRRAQSSGGAKGA